MRKKSILLLLLLALLLLSQISFGFQTDEISNDIREYQGLFLDIESNNYAMDIQNQINKIYKSKVSGNLQGIHKEHEALFTHLINYEKKIGLKNLTLSEYNMLNEDIIKLEDKLKQREPGTKLEISRGSYMAACLFLFIFILLAIKAPIEETLY